MLRRIESGWRYNLAQWVLKLLFGRPWHFISPWPQAGPAAGVVIFYQGQVLLHQRRGEIEEAGKWGVNGGYLNFSLNESFQEGIARELFEETGLQARPASFGEPLWVTMLYGQEKLEMTDHAGVGCWYAVQAPHDLLPLVQSTEEAHNYRWATEAEVMRMIAADEFNTEEACEILRRSFAAFKAGPLPVLELFS